MPRALFLDRDGVVNADAGYIYKIPDFIFMDGVFDLCRTARALDYLLIVATNQSGIGRGFFSEADYQALTDWMRARFAEEGAPLAGVYHCPYHPEAKAPYRGQSDWRKPAPGMLLQAAKDFALDLPGSVLVGDKESDIMAARAAGVGKAVRLGDPAALVSEADAVIASLAGIAAWLKRHTAS